MRWGFIDGEPTVSFVQSADPTDLENRLNALLDYINGLATQSIVAIELAGAGLGDIFTIRVEYGSAGDAWDFSPPGPDVLGVTPGGFTCPDPADITPAIYMADNAYELAQERIRHYADHAFPQSSMIIGSELAGATQARRVCVLELIGPESLYTPMDEGQGPI